VLGLTVVVVVKGFDGVIKGLRILRPGPDLHSFPLHRGKSIFQVLQALKCG